MRDFGHFDRIGKNHFSPFDRIGKKKSNNFLKMTHI